MSIHQRPGEDFDIRSLPKRMTKSAGTFGSGWRQVFYTPYELTLELADGVNRNGGWQTEQSELLAPWLARQVHWLLAHPFGLKSATNYVRAYVEFYPTKDTFEITTFGTITKCLDSVGWNNPEVLMIHVGKHKTKIVVEEEWLNENRS